MIPLGAIIFIAGSSSAFAAILRFCGEETPMSPPPPSRKCSVSKQQKQKQQQKQQQKHT